MINAFRKYLHDIKPTKAGTWCIVLMAVGLPMMIDIFLLPLSGKMGLMYVTSFMIRNYVAILLMSFVYHVIYFLIKYFYQRFFSK